jgi:BolA protein
VTSPPAHQRDTVALIRERLQTLQPETIEVYDESGDHIGHAGAAAGGGHYQVTIVSSRFEGQSRVVRHRMVYAALEGLISGQIHALAITAWTPAELTATFAHRTPDAGASPSLDVVTDT